MQLPQFGIEIFKHKQEPKNLHLNQLRDVTSVCKEESIKYKVLNGTLNLLLKLSVESIALYVGVWRRCFIVSEPTRQ